MPGLDSMEVSRAKRIEVESGSRCKCVRNRAGRVWPGSFLGSPGCIG